MKLFNLRKRKELRQKLRSDLPKAERVLWSEMKGSKMGAKFRRQHGIGNYIVDFYCPEKKLVIEIDGDSHFEVDAIKLDQGREACIKSYGMEVLRFTNNEVHNDLENVLDKIKICLL